MKTLIKLLAITVASCAVSAYAVPTLTIFDGSTTITITDGGSGDSCPDLGCVTWIGTIGVWNINVDTGLTKPATGDPNNLEMDLSFVAHSTATGNLSVTWSDDGFMLSRGVTDGIGGTTDGSVSDNVLINGNPIFSLGPFGPGAFSGSTTGNITLNPADVVAMQVLITQTGSGTSTGDKNLKVPEGGSAVALLGLALVGLEGLRRKIRARQA
jgi:hypothetical protein